MTIKLTFENGDQLGRIFKNRTKRFGMRAIRASQATAYRMATDIETLGRLNIELSGNFGSDRWIAGFQCKVSYKSRNNIVLRVTHSVKYWRVFEFGAVIQGKPLLWIPLSFAFDALGVRARDYGRPLFRVDRPGKAPLLMTNTGGGKAEAKYFGKESVTIPKKWHIREIVKEVSRTAPAIYREEMAKAKSNG